MEVEVIPMEPMRPSKQLQQLDMYLTAGQVLESQIQTPQPPRFP